MSRKDARVTEVLLTTKGRRQAEIARRLARELLNRTFFDAAPGDIAELNAALRRLFDRLA